MTDDAGLQLLPNARWVGGQTMVGGRVGDHAFLRLAQLDDAPEAGLDWIRGLPPGVILDLRSTGEIRRPHPLAQDPAYRHRPFIDESRDHERDREAEHSRADLYRGSLDRNRRTVAIAVQTLLDTSDGPILLHCRSGVDRTGLLIALLLDSVGVDRSAIIADYATYRPAPGQSMPADPPEAVAMIETLAYLDEHYGGSLGYLRSAGLPADVDDRLADRLGRVAAREGVRSSG